MCGKVWHTLIQNELYVFKEFWFSMMWWNNKQLIEFIVITCHARWYSKLVQWCFNCTVWLDIICSIDIDYKNDSSGSELKSILISEMVDTQTYGAVLKRIIILGRIEYRILFVWWKLNESNIEYYSVIKKIFEYYSNTLEYSNLFE